MKSCSYCVFNDEMDERCTLHNMPIPNDEADRTMIAGKCDTYNSIRTYETLKKESRKAQDRDAFR